MIILNERTYTISDISILKDNSYNLSILEESSNYIQSITIKYVEPISTYTNLEDILLNTNSELYGGIKVESDNQFINAKLIKWNGIYEESKSIPTKINTAYGIVDINKLYSVSTYEYYVNMTDKDIFELNNYQLTKESLGILLEEMTNRNILIELILSKVREAISNTTTLEEVQNLPNVNWPS